MTLVVARLEPENNIHVIIEGFLMANLDRKLVIVGNFLSSKYKQAVDNILEKYDAFDKVIFTGAIYEKDILNMLRNNCFAYFHGHSAGGTNPSLLEIMAMKSIIIAHDNEFNREVGGDAIFYFVDRDDLAELIKSIENNHSKYSKLKQITFSRVSINYSWNKIIDEYYSLFKLI